MSNPFSETSRLYAQNFSVIEAVKSEFQREVDIFLERVYKKVQAATADKSSQGISKDRNRTWKIGAPKEEDLPYLWVEGSAVEIVHPGEVALQVCAPKASPDQLRSLKGVASRQEFSPICEVGKGEPGPFKLFTAKIRYGEEDPVQSVSQIAATLLLALNDAYKSASRAEPSSSGKRNLAPPRPKGQ